MRQALVLYWADKPFDAKGVAQKCYVMTRDLNSLQRCDLLAANPNDQNRVREGVPFDALKVQAKEAVEICDMAVKQNPKEPRLQYQLARALQFSDRKRAFVLLQGLVSIRYPAAFGNIGWIVLAENPQEAVNYFSRGVDLGDFDSMLSLAEMIDRNYAFPRGPKKQSWRWITVQLNWGIKPPLKQSRSNCESLVKLV